MESNVTLWFVNVTDPGTVLAAEPKADRGFGRKYLAQLNPAWPITPIGQFPLNRSAQASPGEFYIAGFPGITIVQTVIEDTPSLSELSPRLLDSIPAKDIYAFAVNRDTGYGGIAHWHDGVLKRSLCAERTRTYEDVGLPIPFESPFWAGERAEAAGGISLPFEPIGLVDQAQRSWLGVDISPDGPDIHVVGYAVDGRPEPKVAEAPRHRAQPESGRATDQPTDRDPEQGPGDYDDYEDHRDEDASADGLARLADTTGTAARRIGRGLGGWLRRSRDYVTEKLRHIDRD